MAATIQLKTGTGTPVVVLAKGEPAFDTLNKILYVGDGLANYPINAGIPKISFTQCIDLQQVSAVIASKTGTVTGTDGFGSSLFLKRMMIGGIMNLSEIDVAMRIDFPATNQGAGTMSRSFGIYSFSNSTKLALVTSVSSSYVWSTGTSTTAGAVSLTQFQGGWSTPLIQPLTFNSTSLAAGEYVIGQLFDFAQGSSTWTLNLYGANANSSLLAAAATNLTSATLGAMSSGGLLGVSGYSSSASTALTAWTATPTGANAMLSGGLLAASAFTATTGTALTAFTATPTAANVMLSAALLGVSAHSGSTGTALTAWTATPTASNAQASGGLVAISGFTATTGTALTAWTATPTGANVQSSGGLSSFGNIRLISHSNMTVGMTLGASATNGALSGLSTQATLTLTTLFSTGSYFAGITGSGAVFSNAGTAGVGLLSSGGLSGGSFFAGVTGSFAALVNAGTAGVGLMSSGGLIGGSFFTAATGSSAVLANAGTAGVGLMSSGGLLAGSFFTSSASAAVLANAGTAAVSLLSTGGLIAGSFFSSSSSFGAVTNVALGALNSSTLAAVTLPNFGYIGTGSTTSGIPTAFIAGIMSTGAIPAAITLTSTNVTMSGSYAFQIPYFALVGA